MVETSTDRTITTLLNGWYRGDPGAVDALGRRVYGDLRGIAGRHLGPARNGEDLGATILVHESFLRLMRQRARFVDRHHFFALATRLMSSARGLGVGALSYAALATTVKSALGDRIGCCRATVIVRCAMSPWGNEMAGQDTSPAW